MNPYEPLRRFQFGPMRLAAIAVSVTQVLLLVLYPYFWYAPIAWLDNYHGVRNQGLFWFFYFIAPLVLPVLTFIAASLVFILDRSATKLALLFACTAFQVFYLLVVYFML